MITTNAEIDRITKALSRQMATNRVSVMRESRIQDAIAVALADIGEVAEAEYVLSGASRIDFFLPESGVGIEVKRANAGLNVLPQIGRYIEHSQVRGIILIASRIHPKFPRELQGKPINHLELWRLCL